MWAWSVWSKNKETFNWIIPVLLDMMLPVGVTLSRGLMAEVSYSVVVRLVRPEPRLEAELLLVVVTGPHHHAAKTELAGDLRDHIVIHNGRRSRGHRRDGGHWSKAPRPDSLVSPPFQHNLNVS